MRHLAAFILRLAATAAADPNRARTGEAVLRHGRRLIPLSSLDGYEALLAAADGYAR